MIKLTKVHFDFDKSEDDELGPHIHYTTGAASKMDEAFLFKSNDNELTDTEKDILKKINKKDEDMDESILKEMQDEIKNLKEDNVKLQKQLKIETISKEITEFEFSEDIITDINKVLADMDDDSKAIVLKAFSFLKKNVDVDNTLQKQLIEEVGSDAKVDEAVSKSIIDKIKENRKENK